MIVDDFIKYFSSVLGRTKRTCEEYRKEIIFFSKTLEQKENLDNTLLNVKKKDVIKYIESCSSLATSTRARKISMLRSFYKWCVEMSYIEENPVEGIARPRVVQNPPKYLTLNQVKNLVGSVHSTPDEFYRKRNTAIILVFVTCGLRLTELTTITLQDIYDDCIRIKGKGGKERYVYLIDSCKDAIQEWMEIRGSKPGHLFTSRERKGLVPNTVSVMVKGELRKVGLDHFSTHTLRHTAATLLYRYGNVDIRTLQTILGHASVSTTEIYTHVVNEQIIEAMEKHPLNHL